MTNMIRNKLKDTKAPIQPIFWPGCGTCYVDQTRRHLTTRFREHRNTKTGAVRSHFRKCIGSAPEVKNLKILAIFDQPLALVCKRNL